MDKPLVFLKEHDHEELVYRYDKDTGLRALIAVHNTTLGPALGGTRLWHYDSTEEAVIDVLRLSEGMTYKAAVAGLNLGGGKSVIMADGREDDPLVRAERFEAFGAMVACFDGRYICAEDVGTTTDDMVYIQKHTDNVVGLAGRSGDPSPVTAYGVLRGIQACAAAGLGSDDLNGVRVAVQGLGKVGLILAELLIQAGAEVTGCDVSPDAIQKAQALGVNIVDTDAIYDVPCDIFAPCALGATINDETIPRLTASIIAGAANNQLDDPVRHGQLLHDAGVIYAVDYVINAGGLINVSFELTGYDRDAARAKTGAIYDTITRMIDISRREGIPTVLAARHIANEMLNADTMPAL